MVEKINYKHIKALALLIFLIIWIIGIIIGYRKGKEIARQKQMPSKYISVLKEKIRPAKGTDNIMAAKPKIFEIAQEEFAPVNYVYRISMKGKLKIIDEAGNVIKSSSGEEMLYNLFVYNIIDTDLKSEEELKEEIKFKLEPQLQEEYYPGIAEEIEIEQTTSAPEIKEPKSVIKTNI